MRLSSNPGKAAEIGKKPDFAVKEKERKGEN